MIEHLGLKPQGMGKVPHAGSMMQFVWLYKFRYVDMGVKLW
jgi:hypothetical protein